MIQYRQQFIDILDNNAVVLQFDSKEDHEACQLVLEDPTIIPRQDDLANTSYAYWYLYSATSSDSDSDSDSASESQQRQERHKYNACLKEIRRHFVGEGKDLTKTLNAVHEALDYRSKYEINDLIRPCFYRDTNDIDDEDSTAKKLSTKRRRIRKLIQQDLQERQALLIAPSKGSGGDRYGRQIVYKGNRVGVVHSDTEKEADEDDDEDDDEVQQGTMSVEDEAWMYAQLYTAERCVAYEEFRSYYHNNNTNRRGQQEEEEKKFTVIFDFENYSSKYSPSTSVVTNLTSVLQRCYPERLGTIIILKPPFWMRAFFLILRPFMSKATTDKLNLLTGDDHIDETLHDLVGHDDQLATALATGSIVSST
eukprot:CAMPEP_0113492578 /NCGR_PEP_ID=MMETSP0014_2-20120614/28151_1 /TAXON_ID=2857 /ORGANISM="Nitzschia sp." /LENGTH=365 /DNA_ID=CAMNT_0000386419 /DNA_START=112 /DNA_END=1205 /DNA_ORIENTATION=- /assembly_acc=CAM_ASM_000159